MPYEVHDDKIVMRAGKYSLPPRCCCGEPWLLNTVHREELPCFLYVAPDAVEAWTPLPDGIKDELNQWQSKYNIMSYVEAWLKEANT